MRVFDEDTRIVTNIVQLSDEELSLFSVEEIDLRIAMLEAEIERLKSDRLKKDCSRAAAEALFR